MKKVFTVMILIIGLISVQYAGAQKIVSEDDSEKSSKKVKPMEEYEYGFKLGFNYAKISSTTSTNQKARWGLLLGFFGKYNWTKDFAFQAELLYSQAGFNENTITYDHLYDLDYIELPIYFKYKFKISRSMMSSVYAGPDFGFLISATYEKKSTEENGVDFEPEDLDQLNGFSLGLSIGFDITTKISDLGDFLIDLRYNGLYLTKINTVNRQHPYLYSYEATHNILSLSLGYYF